MPINIDIPEAVIRNAVAVAVAESFVPERRDALLRDIVRAHLQVKENEYDKQTLLAKQVGAVVRRIAEDETTRVLDSMRPDIERIVCETLGEQFKTGVFASLRASLARVVVGHITVSVDLDRRYDDNV
ncbi:MAG: hypothetical protein HYY29_03530 [Chloroflexi bacterium]|nr:hypothetical protein [Chloroflexota bacterium]